VSLAAVTQVPTNESAIPALVSGTKSLAQEEIDRKKKATTVISKVKRMNFDVMIIDFKANILIVVAYFFVAVKFNVSILR
jgi:hypothetical protein